jgi:hypothetical protein
MRYHGLATLLARAYLPWPVAAAVRCPPCNRKTGDRLSSSVGFVNSAPGAAPHDASLRAARSKG